MSDLKARHGHCAGALVLSSRLTEVIIFGGRDFFNNLSSTTVLRFGEYTIRMCFTHSHILLFPTTEVNGLSCSDSWNKCQMSLTLKLPEKQ